MSQQLGLGVTLGLFLVGPPWLHAEQSVSEGRPHVVLFVCNKAGVDAETQLVAKNETARILSTAGVDMIWLHTRSDSETTFKRTSFDRCELPSIANYFLIVISSKSPRGSLDVMGFAQAGIV